MEDQRARLLALLDDYYGDSRDQMFREEICDFIEGYAKDIHQIMGDEKPD